MTISIIAPNIKSGGGLELLLYLIEYIDSEYPTTDVVVYVDQSIQMIKSTKHIQIIHLKTTSEKIKLFSKQIDNALYFGNLPPLRKSNTSILYIHNPYLLMSYRNLSKTSFKFFIKYSLQKLYIKLFTHNVDLIAVQNELMKKSIVDIYKFTNIKLLPFFRLCNRELLKTNSKLYDFCYVSLAHVHKNHDRLLEACHLLSEERIPLRLALTIEDGHEDLMQKIEAVNNKGVVEVVNLGLLAKEDVCALYAQSKCLVFPSTQETFGLALIEAANMDLDIIAADLDYVYQSVKPSLTFDPTSSLDIADKLKTYLNAGAERSEPIIKSKLDELINILKEEK